MFLRADTRREINRRFLCVFQNSHATCTHAHTNTHTQSSTQVDLFVQYNKSHLFFRASCTVIISPKI